MAAEVRDLNKSARFPGLNLKALSTEKLRLLLYLGTALLALLALYIVLNAMVSWGRVAFDDMRYGVPRTFHLTADVGHGGGSGLPSHLIAVNLDRQVIVIDIPGGDADKIRTLRGPYLFGEGEDLTPVTMHLDDMDGDTHSDLIVRVKDEEIIYLNQEGGFVLPSVEERRSLMQQGSEAAQP